MPKRKHGAVYMIRRDEKAGDWVLSRIFAGQRFGIFASTAKDEVETTLGYLLDVEPGVVVRME